MTRPLSLWNQPDAQHVYRVGELNRETQGVLEEAYRRVWVEGEFSEVHRHASGHVYFTLNDPKEVAQLRGVMFRSDARRAKAKLERGEAVRLQGQLSIYPERGQYQLMARIALPVGAGNLHAQFERIKAKLAADGLLATERKRALPPYPRIVGVVTSAHGAAMHDVIRVSQGRFPVRLVVSDCRVQGESAPQEIVAALRRVQRVDGLDVVIVARGGGSGEDLWAFNHEAVARAIAEARVPVVVGVGHEVDVTLSDLVADVRAATPSNAAELVLPDRIAVEATVSDLRHRLERAVAMRIDRERLKLERTDRAVRDPQRRLRQVHERILRVQASLASAVRTRLKNDRARLEEWRKRLSRLDTRRRLADHRKALGWAQDDLKRLIQPTLSQHRAWFDGRRSRLDRAAAQLIPSRRERLALLTARARAMNPYDVLERGYAIALKDGKVLMDAHAARPGDVLDLRLRHGNVRVRVEDIGTGREIPSTPEDER